MDTGQKVGWWISLVIVTASIVADVVLGRLVERHNEQCRIENRAREIVAMQQQQREES